MELVREDGAPLEMEEVDIGQPGVRVVLPSAFPGSPRNMHQRYVDAMAMMAELGKPDLFITMSCNPSWPEIVNNIQPHMNPEDQVVLACRVFHIKLKDFIDQIVDRKIFGEIRYYTYSIEFQKRGLPHAHFLIALVQRDKLFTPQQVDDCIRAEIPIVNDTSSRADKEYAKLVKRHMMHGPCGADLPSDRCWRDGRCSKKFPKEFHEATTFRTNGYPIYRRRDNGASMMRDGRRLDNRWVVPHNRYLLEVYNCHINVEHCTMVDVVKYMFKCLCG
ncbi:uncharacterized protein LOC129808622 [Phlebotomus papatasi]|uniref:uncharacterized protein LOC129808622 n=1 Tax=Phlebotomus papatasi TaxID=29031 RepID=UPI0024846A60|nr:uncharacterized protein LOC129808622 [Phlebotomus papatasi]